MQSAQFYLDAFKVAYLRLEKEFCKLFQAGLWGENLASFLAFEYAASFSDAFRFFSRLRLAQAGLLGGIFGVSGAFG